ncbi:hypothetical protein ACHAXT_000946 [Thalassiosira profunda]
MFVLLTARPLLFPLSLLLSLSITSAYTILGGLGDDTRKDTDDANDGFATETLRHFSPPRTVKLRTQSHEASGRVSMAGTLWEASPLLADFVTNPACPLEAFQRMRVHEDTNPGRLQVQPSTVVELGSGVGLASLAAAFLGCRVYATDGSPSSIRLLQENFERYATDCPVLPRASMLEWGDEKAAESLLQKEPPDVIMASDVVYAHSAREELSKTIRHLCPRGHLHGRVIIAHRWRSDTADEESFFKSFDKDFEREEVGMEFLPEDAYYRTRSMIDMKLPVSIFEMKRKG